MPGVLQAKSEIKLRRNPVHASKAEWKWARNVDEVYACLWKDLAFI